MIYTSSPLVVRADTTIAECVRLMCEHNVGSVLVVSDTGDETLIGIFTERDLLKKSDLIQAKGRWEYPVRSVMSSPVKTLDPSQIHVAGKLMLQGNFRHFPIVTKDANGKQRIVGVVSMRDLFRNLVLQEEKKALVELQDRSRVKGHPLKVLVLTNEDHFSDFIAQVFNSVLNMKTRRVELDFDYGPKPHAVIFDIDGFTNGVWPKRLAEFNRDPMVKLIIVAFDPALHKPELMQMIEKLGKSEKIWVFKKPIEVFELLNRLTSRGTS